MGKVNAKLGTDYQLFNYYGAARRGPRDHRHGLHLRRGRGSHRLPERPRREGRPGQGPPVPPVRSGQAARCHPRVPARRSPSSTARRNPAPWANPCIWTLSPHWPTPARHDIQVIGGRYGLGSKDTPPASVFAVYEELAKDEPKRQFTIGIVDDVTNLSLEEQERPQHRRRRHHRVQVLGSGRRRHRWREQELHQDHRRPYRQVCAGLLPVRLQEDRRRDHQPPALRRQAHQEPVLYQQGRLRRLPQPVLYHQGLPDRPRRQARRRVHDQLPVG